MDLFDRFATAFNDRDLDALAELLADDAVARVDGAPFPEERGRDMIRKTSLHYLLEENALRAARHEGWILLRDGDGRLDCAVEARTDGDRITSLRYVTEPHRPDEFGRLTGMP
jgi:ketosteroid isomerase-like protein